MGRGGEGGGGRKLILKPNFPKTSDNKINR